MDRRALLLSSMALSGSAGLAGAPAAAAPSAEGVLETEGPGVRAYGPAMQQISAYADLHLTGYRLPGLTVVCVDRDGFTGFIRTGHAEVESRRPVAAGDLFQIGSISKSFIALIIHQLAAEGRLRLDDDVRQHLPGVALPDAPAISLTHLLQHSSGLPDDAPLFPHTPEGKLWSAFAPGSAWSYSNTGYLILGRIIERADGRSLAESLQRRIFSPLGMPKAQGRIMAKDRALYTAGYSPRDPEAEGSSIVLDRAPWINVTSGAGCVAATSRDMAAWLRFLLAAGAGHGAGLLSDDQARAYAAPGIAAPGWSAPGSDVGPATYGSGLAHVTVEGRSLLHHTGGMLAYSSAMHVDPVAGVACFASTNMGGEGYRPRDITAYACARLRSVREPQAGLSPQPRAIKPLRPAAATAPIRTGAPDPALAALTGRYETDDPWTGAVTITCAGDRLMLDGDVALEQSPQGYWTPKGALSTERLWFLSLAQGRPQVLSLSGRLLERRDL